MANYFPCTIYNTDSPRGDEPAYAILSMQPGFGLSDAKRHFAEHPPRNVFILVNGQQTLERRTNDNVDIWFGRPLCGIDRIGEKEEDPDTGGTGFWSGDYRIYTSASGVRSVASAIFDEYGHRDLIIDVVNAKFDYEAAYHANHSTFNNFCRILEDLLKAIGDTSQLRFFLGGFSRGGIFAIRLAEWLKRHKHGAEVIAATIDPVVTIRERDDLLEEWGDWKVIGQKWDLTAHKSGKHKYFFPVLRSEADIHYNVFERDTLGIWRAVIGALGILGTAAFPAANTTIGFPAAPTGGAGVGAIAGFASYFAGPWFPPKDYPIGSAVKNAISPGYDLTGDRKHSPDKKYSKLPSGAPWDQLDINEDAHTAMPARYAAWMMEIVFRHFPNPVETEAPEEPEPLSLQASISLPHGPAGTELRAQVRIPEPYRSELQLQVAGGPCAFTWEDAEHIRFTIPGTLSPGSHPIVFELRELSRRSFFTVTPFLTGLIASSPYHDGNVTLQGTYPSSASVYVDGSEVVGQMTGGYLSFSIPDDLPTGEHTVTLRNAQGQESNPRVFTLYKAFHTDASCSPDRFTQYKAPESVHLQGNGFLRGDKVLLNMSEMKCKVLNSNEIRILLPAHLPVARNEARIRRRDENGDLLLSNPVYFMVCDLVGNTNEMELHYDHCSHVPRIAEEHRVLFCGPWEAGQIIGYDNCHWCIGGSAR